MLLVLLIQSISFVRKRAWISVVGIASLLHAAKVDLAGANVTLSWHRNPESNVSGYKIHYGTASRSYPFVIDAGNSTAQPIANLQDGVTYYFAVTAYNVHGESDFSGELSYTVPQRSIFALGDGSYRIRFQGLPERTYRIEYTDSLTNPNWQTLDTRLADLNGSFEIIDWPIMGSAARFYRSVHPAR